jgi:hypothetical protein
MSELPFLLLLSPSTIAPFLFWGIILVWIVFSALSSFHILSYGKSLVGIFSLALYFFVSVALIGAAGIQLSLYVA